MDVSDGPNEWDAIMSVQEKEDEIRRLTVPEDLSEIQKCLMQLTGGHAIQQMHAIERLPAVASLSGRDGLEQVLPAVLDSLMVLSTDAQIATADALLEVVQRGLISKHDTLDLILPLALALMHQPASDEVLDGWVHLALAILPLMDAAAVKGKILLFAAARGVDREMGAQGRLLCAALLGAAAQRLPREDVEQDCLPKFIALCQDTERAVRRCAGDQLPLLAHSLGSEAACSRVLPKVFEMTEDEDASVCCSAVTALGSILSLLTPELRRGKVYPYIRSLCVSGQAESKLQQCLPKLLAESMCKVAAEQDGDADMALLLTAFKDLAANLHPRCRLQCAEALPVVLSHATGRRYATYLHDTLAALAADKDADVRHQLASCFYLIPQLLTRERCLQHLKRPFIQLLGDSEARVRKALLRHLSEILGGFAGKNAREDAKLGDDLAANVAKLEMSLGLDWRLQHSLLMAIPAMAQIMSTDALYDVLVPLAMRHLGSGPAVLQEPAADAIVALMRAVQKPYQRTDILCRLLRENAQAPSCHRRLAFLNAAAAMQERYSTRFFKANVVSWVCNLASDVTVPVRMRSASVMASARRAAESSGNADLAAMLEASLSCLQGDVSAYVRACAQEGHQVGDAVHASSRLPAASSRDLQLEAEEAEAPFIHEELDRLHREQLLEKRRWVAATTAKRPRVIPGAPTANLPLKADAQKSAAASSGKSLHPLHLEADATSNTSAAPSVPPAASLSGSSSADPQDPKASTALRSAKGKGSDTARLAARLAKLSNDANMQLTQVQDAHYKLGLPVGKEETRLGSKGGPSILSASVKRG